MVDGCHGERSSRMLTDVMGGRMFSKYLGLPMGGVADDEVVVVVVPYDRYENLRW